MNAREIIIRPFIFISLFHEPADSSFEELEKIKMHFKTFLFAPIRNSKISEYLLRIRIYSTKNCALYYTLKHAASNMSNIFAGYTYQLKLIISDYQLSKITRLLVVNLVNLQKKVSISPLSESLLTSLSATTSPF